MRCLIAIAAIAPLIAVGCAGVRSAGTREQAVVRSSAEPSDAYRIGCPDVLTVRFADQPQLDCVVAVDLEGRLPISETALPHVEGRTLDDARTAVAAACGCDERRVQVQLADARTGKVYVFGPEQNRQRVVSYVGPERLTDFLHRTGSLRHGCTNLRDVFVLRPNVAAGEPPRILRTDLRALRKGDYTTNVILESGDQVYVGETRRSSFARLLPDWIRAVYCRITGLCPTPTSK